MGSFLKGEYKRSHPAGVMGFGGGGGSAPETGPRNPMVAYEQLSPAEKKKRGGYMTRANSILGGGDDSDGGAAAAAAAAAGDAAGPGSGMSA